MIGIAELSSVADTLPLRCDCSSNNHSIFKVILMSISLAIKEIHLILSNLVDSDYICRLYILLIEYFQMRDRTSRFMQ